jgi:hypothetical protein
VPKLTVKVSPEVGATIRVAGLVITGDTADVAREPGFVSVAVSAPGYLPYRKLIEVRGDAVVVIKLRALPSKRRHVQPYILMAMVLFALVKMVLSCR